MGHKKKIKGKITGNTVNVQERYWGSHRELMLKRRGSVSRHVLGAQGAKLTGNAKEHTEMGGNSLGIHGKT